jgi:cation-transporting ATPase E
MRVQGQRRAETRAAAGADGGGSFLAVRGLLLVMFVEPPSRYWAVADETCGDRRPTWLAMVLLIGLLAIAVVHPC